MASSPEQPTFYGVNPALLLPALLALNAHPGPGGLPAPKEAALELRIPAFPNGGAVPRVHAADGADRSPALHYRPAAASRPHRYFFHLTALSAPLGLPSDTTCAQVDAAMKGKVLAETGWMGTYGR